MNYFYHGIPEDMKGSSLIPLNDMVSVDAGLRDKYLEKYKGREEILDRKIPLLDCLWNDVVQLLPLEPIKLFSLQQKLGIIDTIPDYRYYQIPVGLLDPNKTVVYFKTAPGEESVIVRWLSDVNLDDLQGVPNATADYYKSMIDSGQPVFNYQFVPHIIYKGTIDVSNSQVVSLKDSMYR